jgi:hypothetical protein
VLRAFHSESGRGGGEVKSCSVEDGRARSGVAAEKGTPTAIGVAFNRRRERKEGLA